MKNIQVIDGALNCSYSICAADDSDFFEIFPLPGQNIEFVEDLIERVGEERAAILVRNTTTRRVKKCDVKGIDGTLFFQLTEKRRLYPNKRDDDVI